MGVKASGILLLLISLTARLFILTFDSMKTKETGYSFTPGFVICFMHGELSIHILCSFVLLLSSLISLTIQLFMIISFSVCTANNIHPLICVHVFSMCLSFYWYVPKSTEFSLYILLSIY